MDACSMRWRKAYKTRNKQAKQKLMCTFFCECYWNFYSIMGVAKCFMVKTMVSMILSWQEH